MSVLAADQNLLTTPAMMIVVPPDLHPETKLLVRAFAEELARKLRADEIKHGFGDEWRTDLWEAQCRNDLFKHLLKGDPRDVAAYCAFMWRRGWRIFAATMEQIKRDPDGDEETRPA